MDAAGEREPARILLVEDEPSISRLVATVLRSEGFAPTVVPDYQHALEQLTDPTFRVVIADTDRGAQSLNLSSFAPLVAAAGDRPVFLFSAHRFRESAVVEAGLAGWIRKPFDIDEFLTKVRAALRPGEDEPDAETEV